MAILIYGINPVREALKHGRTIDQIMLLDGGQGRGIREIQQLARAAGIKITLLARADMDRLVRHSHHQGVIAEAADYEYACVDDLLILAYQRRQSPLLAILDGVQDPHNLGAIIRSAESAGIHGIIIPQHHAAGITPAVVKASAGAIAHIKIAQVVNIHQTIQALKRQNIQIVGSSATAVDSYLQADLQRATAIVLGSEGKGMRQSTEGICDQLVRIPMYGQLNSLNVSVSAAILFFEACRQRGIAPAKEG